MVHWPLMGWKRGEAWAGSIDNRGIYRHRIANFPNYVTLTSSLTHHRIVNLGAHGATTTCVSNFSLLLTL